MDTLQEIIYIEFSCENLTRLTYYCNFSNGQLYDSSLLSLPLTQLGAPATFFICLLHVLVSLLLAVIVFICFNSVRVLGKNWNITNTSAHTLARSLHDMSCANNNRFTVVVCFRSAFYASGM